MSLLRCKGCPLFTDCSVKLQAERETRHPQHIQRRISGMVKDCRTGWREEQGRGLRRFAEPEEDKTLDTWGQIFIIRRSFIWKFPGLGPSPHPHIQRFLGDRSSRRPPCVVCGHPTLFPLWPFWLLTHPALATRAPLAPDVLQEHFLLRILVFAVTALFPSYLPTDLPLLELNQHCRSPGCPPLFLPL